MRASSFILTLILPVAFIGCSGLPAAQSARCSSDPAGRFTGTAMDFREVDVRPEIAGGTSALIDNLEYPLEARRRGIQGVVRVAFVVDEQGCIHEATVVDTVHEMLNEHAMAAIARTRFIPGQEGGQPVAVRMEIPLSFTMQ